MSWGRAFRGRPGERLRYLLARGLGLRVISDMYERAADLRLALPPGRRRRRRITAIRGAGVLFVHIPKNAGQSVSMALYGLQVQHATIRFYASTAPDIARLPSFAILRDPVERFVSAYHYGRAGGGGDNLINPGFRDLYQGFAGIDDALDHVEQATTPYAVDHVFRPQSWYVTDRAGHLAVDRLFAFADLSRLAEWVPQVGGDGIGYLNRGDGDAAGAALTEEQVARIRLLYARDYALIAEAEAGGNRPLA